MTNTVIGLCRKSILAQIVVAVVCFVVVIVPALKLRDTAWVRFNSRLESVAPGSSCEHAKQVLGVLYDDYRPTVVGEHYGDEILRTIDVDGKADVILVYRVPCAGILSGRRLFLAFSDDRLVGKAIR